MPKKTENTEVVSQRQAPTDANTKRKRGYDAESSDCRAVGTVWIDQTAWWSAELAIAKTGDQSALLTIERHGPSPLGVPAGEQVSLVIPPGEAEALVQLVRGIVAHARRDTILSNAKLD